MARKLAQKMEESVLLSAGENDSSPPPQGLSPGGCHPSLQGQLLWPSLLSKGGSEVSLRRKLTCLSYSSGPRPTPLCPSRLTSASSVACFGQCVFIPSESSCREFRFRFATLPRLFFLTPTVKRNGSSSFLGGWN